MSPGHFFLMGLLLFWGASADATELAARDAQTGAPVAAQLRYETAEGPRAFAVDGRLQALAAPAARVTAEAEAPGYQALTFILDPSTRSMTVLLEPIETPEKFQQLQARVNDQADKAWLQGYVRRADDGSAIPGAQLRLDDERVQTDEDGYFELAVSAQTGDELQRSTLRVHAAGIGDREISGLHLAPSIQRMVVALDRQGLVVDRNVIGALDITAERQMDTQSDSLGLDDGGLPARAQDGMGIMVAPGIVPPPSIRVGFSDAAIARTPGILLSRDSNQAASSEYSSENNSWKDPGSTLLCSNGDLSCGNGFAGSPVTGWPCLSDAVGLGKTCHGHGRGMSQWGTQRWAIAATPQRWPWIVDHYFNAHGAGSGLRTAVMTSPLVLSGVAAQPSTILPGAIFQISAQAHNHAGATHSRLLMGASLYRSGVGYIDDSTNDTAQAVQPGTQVVARDFLVPVGTSAGVYDVLVSLYLDVDENGLISSADLPLALVTASAALHITSPAAAIFADGFEQN